MRKLYLYLPFLVTILWCSCDPKKSGSNTPQPTDGVFAHPSVASVSKEIDADPQNASLFFKRAKALRALQEDSLALNDFRQAIKLDSSKAPYFSAIGELLFEHKDIDGSVKWFKKAIDINPKDPVAHLKFAKMLIYTDDNQKAFTEINTVLRQDPYNAEAYFLKGAVYKNLNDTLKAISSFQTSVQVDPNYQPSIMQLALIYAAKRDFLAIKYFDNAYKADTTQLMAWYGKAMFYQDNGQFEKAKDIYTECIVRDPQYADAFFNTGWILMHQDSLEKATRQFDFVTKIEPDNAEAYYNRGLCYELLKLPAKAIADYTQAIQFDAEYQEPKDGIKRLAKKK